jgi:hypothetical protein
VDVQTIDQNYAELQRESQETIDAITKLAQKLQAASDAGDTNAREWMLDLKEVAVSLRDEQTKVSGLLQSLHAFTVNQLNQQPQYQAAPPLGYQQQPPQYAQPGYSQGGGVLHHFMGGGFGRAIAMGAGFGLGDDLINRIF